MTTRSSATTGDRTLNCNICDADGAPGRYQARALYEGVCARCWLDSVVDGVHQVVECPDAVLRCPSCQRLGLRRIPDPLVTTWDCTHCGAVLLCVEDVEEAIREHLGLPSRPVGMVL